MSSPFVSKDNDVLLLTWTYLRGSLADVFSSLDEGRLMIQSQCSCLMPFMAVLRVTARLSLIWFLTSFYIKPYSNLVEQSVA